MKKALLTFVALTAVSAGFAQSKVDAGQIFGKKVGDYTSIQAPVKHELDNGNFVALAPKKGKAEGMYYARPAGTYWLYGSTAKYLVVPPFTDLAFINVSEDKSGTWSIGSSDLSDYVTGDSLVFSYSKPSPGYVSYCPVLTTGDLTYQVADYVYPLDSVAEGFYPFNYKDCPRYYGFSGGGSAFMSGADSFDFDGDGTEETFYPEFRQFFEQPATPLAMNEVILWASSTDKNFTGSTLKLVFNKVSRDEKNRRIIGEEFATMECVSAEMDGETISGSNVYPGTLTFANMVVDEFGTKEAQPIFLDEEFAITIKGTLEKGVDVRFYFCDQGEYPEEWYTRATPTYIVPYDAEGNLMVRPDGNPNGLSYFGESSSYGPYCYNIAFIFYGAMDGIEVVTSSDLNKQIAPVEGGETASAPEEGETEGYPAYVYTNFPIFNQDGEEVEYSGNYDFEGIPEWASIKIDPTGYEYKVGTDDEIRGLNMIWFDCEPLPSDVKGRIAEVYVKSAFGLTSAEPIYILQGDTSDITDGVKYIKFDENGKFVNATFNVKGQRVGNDYKGLVIKDGKKVMVK